MVRAFEYYPGMSVGITVLMYSHYCGWGPIDESDTEYRQLKNELERMQVECPFAVFMGFNYEYNGRKDRHRILSEMSGGGYVDFEEAVVSFHNTMEGAEKAAKEYNEEESDSEEEDSDEDYED